MTTFYTALQGLSHSNNVALYEREEENVRAGQVLSFTAVYQCALAQSTLHIVNESLKIRNIAQIPSPLYYPLLFSPLLINYLAYQRRYPLVSNYLSENFGKINLAISVITSVGMIYCGSVAYGTISLSMLSFRIIEKQGLLPQKVSKIFSQSNFILFLTLSGFFGGKIDKFFAVANVTLYCLQHFFPQIGTPTSKLMYPDFGKTPVSAQQLQNGILMPNVNRGHFQYKAMPPIPQVEITELNRIMEDVIQKGYLSRFQRQIVAELLKDDRYRSLNVEKDSLEEKISYMQENIQILVDVLQSRFADEGDDSFRKTFSYLKIITFELNKILDELSTEENSKKEEELVITLAQILIDLSIRTGEYCDPKKDREVGEAYVHLMKRKKELPLEQQILQILQFDRNNRFKGIFQESKYLHPLLGPVRRDYPNLLPVTEHHYNNALNAFGTHLGLPDEGAIDDVSARIDLKDWTLHTLLYGNLELRFHFGSDIPSHYIWRYEDIAPYDASYVLNLVQEQIREKTLTPESFISWWKDVWLKREFPQLSQPQRNEWESMIVDLSRFSELEVGTLRGDLNHNFPFCTNDEIEEMVAELENKDSKKISPFVRMQLSQQNAHGVSQLDDLIATLESFPTFDSVDTELKKALDPFLGKSVTDNRLLTAFLCEQGILHDLSAGAK